MPNRILPALVTPLLPDGRLDEQSAERLIDHLYEKGVGGLFVCGTTGEGIHLEFEVRKRLAEIAVNLSKGRGQTIIHVGAIQAAMAMELADHAFRVGADAVSSIPPFAGGYSWDEVRAYYAQLARRSRLPVVAYYIPGLTQQQRSLDELAVLLGIPNITGLKCSAPDLRVSEQLMSRLAADQVLYHGHDETLAQALASGAHGGIGSTYNFMPELMMQVYRLAQAQRWTEAHAAQRQADAVMQALLPLQNVAATKQILVWQGRIDHATCVFPRAGLTARDEQQLRERLSTTVVAPTLVR